MIENKPSKIIDYRSAEYLVSAPTLKLCPPEDGAEVAFAGRSNAGKSSAINALTGNGKLARTSKTPGRTQLINFFKLMGNDALRLVDLPGYGYAKVPLAMKTKWQKHLSQYLRERESLQGLVLLMDIRHPMQDFDVMMINWAVESQMQCHILLTKSDKLKRGAAQSTKFAVEKHIREANAEGLITVQTFSALKRDGIDTLIKRLNDWLTLPETPEDDSSEPINTAQESDQTPEDETKNAQ